MSGVTEVTRSRVLAILGLVVFLVIALIWHSRQRNLAKRVEPVRSEAIRQKILTEPIRRASVDARHPPVTPDVTNQMVGVGASILDQVHLAVTTDSSASPGRRLNAIHTLHTQLTADEARPLLTYLLTPSFEKQSQVYESCLRNDMLDLLVQQPVLPTGLADALVAIYRDRTQGDVIRDYAVQHIEPIYGRVSSAEQTSLRSALWQATTETDISIAGTSLLALMELSETDPSIGGARLSETVLRLANDDRCGELARIASLQICGQMGLEEALPVVTQLAQSGKTIPLRIAAVASLGQLGDKQTALLLGEISNGREARLQVPAQLAGLRLRKRLGA